MEIKLEYYAVARSGLIFFFEKNFHKEYIVVFVCIRLEFSNTMSISMCMRFHSERTASRTRATLSYPIFLLFRFLLRTTSRSPRIRAFEYQASRLTLLHFAHVTLKVI